jgi:flagellar motor switch protein FliN
MEPTPAQNTSQQPKPAPQGAKFEELKPAASGAGTRDMDFLLDIPLEVTVELGRSKMFIKDLLQLGQGSVIELEKIAGEPMEILVNDKLIARGEVVVVNEKFGIRLTDIISPTERIQKLK